MTFYHKLGTVGRRTETPRAGLVPHTPAPQRNPYEAGKNEKGTRQKI